MYFVFCYESKLLMRNYDVEQLVMLSLSQARTEGSVFPEICQRYASLTSYVGAENFASFSISTLRQCHANATLRLASVLVMGGTKPHSIGGWLPSFLVFFPLVFSFSCVRVCSAFRLGLIFSGFDSTNDDVELRTHEPRTIGFGVCGESWRTVTPDIPSQLFLLLSVPFSLA